MEAALKRISDYRNLSNLPYILFGALVVDIIVILMTKKSLLGESLKIWYDKFGLSAVIADTLILVIGIMIAQYIYTEFFSKTSPLVFVLLVALIQIIHDIIFFQFTILGTPKGQNKVIDLFKVYADELGAKILFGDCMMILGSLAIATASTALPKPLFAFLGIVSVYTVPYILG